MINSFCRLVVIVNVHDTSYRKYGFRYFGFVTISTIAVVIVANTIIRKIFGVLCSSSSSSQIHATIQQLQAKTKNKKKKNTEIKSERKISTLTNRHKNRENIMQNFFFIKSLFACHMKIKKTKMKKIISKYVARWTISCYRILSQTNTSRFFRCGSSNDFNLYRLLQVT